MVKLNSLLTRPKGRVFVSAGFTVVELVVTIIILGVLAAVAAPKFFGKSAYDALGFSQTLSSSLHYAQKLAMRTGCQTRVQIASGSLTLYQGSASCDDASLTRKISKVTGGYFSEALPAGLAVDAIDIYFDARGRPREMSDGNLLASQMVIHVGASRQVMIQPETGYVYAQ